MGEFFKKMQIKITPFEKPQWIKIVLVIATIAALVSLMY
jgi:hypothetical protein